MTPEARRLPSRSLLKVPHQARAVVTVHAILDAAVRVLTGEGAQAFTTNRVAEVAGVSPGTLYQYFANREMILSALVERDVLQAEWLVRGELRALHAAPTEQVLRGALDAVASELERHADSLGEILKLSPLLLQNEMAEMLGTRLLDATRECLARDPARTPPASGAALYVAVNACILVLLRWLAERPPHVSRAQLVDAMLRMYVGALEAPVDPGSPLSAEKGAGDVVDGRAWNDPCCAAGER